MCVRAAVVELSARRPRHRQVAVVWVRTPGAHVLLVVFGVLLVLVGVTATAQAAMVSTYASTSAIAATVDADVGMPPALRRE